MRLFARRRRGRFAETFDALRREGATGAHGWYFDPRTSEAGGALLARPPSDLREFVLEALDEMADARPRYVTDYVVYRTTVTVMRRALPFTEADLIRMLDWSAGRSYDHLRLVPQILSALKRALAGDAPSPELAREMERLAEALLEGYAEAEVRAWAARLRALGGLTGERVPLVSGEAWADAATAEIEGGSHERRLAWASLLEHCSRSSGARPSARWREEAEGSLTALGLAVFSDAVCRWFPLVDRPRTVPAERGSQWMPDPNHLLVDTNADILKGLAWTCALAAERADAVPQLSRALGGLAVSAYRKVPQQGPRCVRVGNACVWALGEMPGTEGVSQLAVLRSRVRFGTAAKAIDKVISGAAARAGISREDIEELAVPHCGFDASGVRREAFGEYVAEARVVGTNGMELRWLRPDGKPQKSVPKAVRGEHAEELAALKAELKEAQKLLPALRDRIEGSYLDGRSWAYGAWRERYLDHPLVGTLARRLIWRFTGPSGVGVGVFLDGRLVDRRGRPMEGLGDGTHVELWHPIGEVPETVVAWRDWLAEWEIQQPFKQAHREVYLLTDAERATGTYSNRFAAHILRQHQFNALCAARGWNNRLRLMVDDDLPPAVREIPAWGLRAEYWVEGIGHEYGWDTNETGTYLYLATDGVRFYASGTATNLAHAYGGAYTSGVATEPVAVGDVPPLVFSEVMRDVDLFVGVASVGNDPNWSDGGPDGRFRDYWTGYAFGDLSASARTRREVLQRVVPRLAIAERCHFEDRFLVVRGRLRTYRIHLGSGNILMAPNDQYLCIVPGRGGAGGTQTFLPFEGDGTLALILSKALMLARDWEIEDPTITGQIRARPIP